MRSFHAVLQTECLKVRKSKVIWITVLAFTIAPLMAGFFMFLLKDPEIAKSTGFLGVKAQIAGEANWLSYIRLHAQMIAVGGLLVFGFVTSWIFGREYADNTAKDLLALPYSRVVIVMAKLVASVITNIALCAYIVCLGFLFGWIIGLPQWSFEMVTKGLFIVLIVSILTIALSTPVAFFASYGGGYLAPLGFVVITLVLSQIVSAAGFGAYFPWAIPSLYSGVTADGYTLEWGGLIIIFTTGALGIL